jgi:two-component system, cell cycle sensor histidine kinase and response regulator CckA
MADNGTDFLSDDRFAAAQFRALLESTAQGIIGVSRNGTIQMANRKAEALFGYGPEELKGERIESLVPERVRHIHAEQREQYAANPYARSMGLGIELMGRRRDGTEFPLEISLNHVSAGGQSLTISLITDTTQRIEIQNQIRQAHKMEAVGQLAGSIAHEFNNLLTVIFGYTGMAMDLARGESDLCGMLQEISNVAYRAASLTERLLAFSRIGALFAKSEWIDLNELLSRMYILLCKLVGAKIEITLNLGEDVGEILADPLQLTDLIVNLTRNAIDAMPRGGRLVIETASIEIDESYTHLALPLNPGPHVLMTVTDTGTGMTPAVQERIFEPFFTTKEAGKGSGLGLSTVYGTVKDAGGAISVSSHLGHGTTFRVIFPLIAQTGLAGQQS